MRPDQGRASPQNDAVPFTVDPGLKLPVDGFEEVVAMVLDMEREEVIPKQALEELALPGTNPEGFRIGPRDMPELANDRPRNSVLNHLGQQGEVVVLDKNQGPGLPDLLDHRLGELLV